MLKSTVPAFDVKGLIHCAELTKDLSSSFIWYTYVFGGVCVHELEAVRDRERKRPRMCIDTSLICCVVGAMVTHQVGAGVGAAVMHLLLETLPAPLLSARHSK